MTDATPRKRPLERVPALLGSWTAQGVFLVFCVAWWAFGGPALALTTALSVVAITITQIVLNAQEQREGEARRRDLALHVKLDELIHAITGARDELAGIEEREEAEILELRR